MDGTIVMATGLKAPPWTLSFTPCQETKSQLTPIVSLIYSALKPKLLNMAFNLACYLCFWKTRTASFKASIAFLPAGLPTSPQEANDASELLSLTALRNPLQWQFPQNNNKAKEKAVKSKISFTNRIDRLLRI